MVRAIVFDLFETLVTEWGHEKYTKRKMSADLGCPLDGFSKLWEGLHEDQYRGRIGLEESLRYICGKLSVDVSDEGIEYVMQKRIKTKSACFDHVHPDIYPLLCDLRERGYKLAILSNCSQDEVLMLKNSKFASLMDEMVLSCETGLCKPQGEIYRLAANKLRVKCDECIFIGDGGSEELYGAKQAGMQPYRAMWYILKMPSPIKEQPGFIRLKKPLDVLDIIK